MMNGRKRIRLGDVILTNNESYSPKEEWSYVNYLDTGSITESSIVEIQRIDLNAEKLHIQLCGQINDILVSSKSCLRIFLCQQDL